MAFNWYYASSHLSSSQSDSNFSGRSFIPPKEVVVLSKRRRHKNGRIQLLDLILDEGDRPIYEPGGWIRGKVALECSDTFRFKFLSVTLKGVAGTAWKVRNGIKKSGITKQIDYINDKKYLLGGMGSGARQRLPEGRHEFDFTFQLPVQDLPTSFEGSLGSIRYFIKAEVEEASSATHKTVAAFTMLARERGPAGAKLARALNPVTVEKEEMLQSTWLCRTTGRVHALISTDRRLYCSGEFIALTGKISNISPFPIRPEVTLCQLQSFQGGSESQRCKEVVVKTLDPEPIDSGSDAIWEPLLLKIPVVCPSIENCDLIRIDYEVRVCFYASGQNSATVIQLPIEIGSVPVALPVRRRPRRGNHAMPSRSASADRLGDDNCTSTSASSIPEPPSYFECLDSQVDLLSETGSESGTSALTLETSSTVYGNTMFTPMYRYVTNYQYQAPPKYDDLFRSAED